METVRSELTALDQRFERESTEYLEEAKTTGEYRKAFLLNCTMRLLRSALNIAMEERNAGSITEAYRSMRQYIRSEKGFSMAERIWKSALERGATETVPVYRIVRESRHMLEYYFLEDEEAQDNTKAA